MDIIAVTVRKVNCYLVDAGAGLLAFDAGWPGSWRDFRDAIKAAGRKPEEIRWLIVSHFHVDHGGLAGECQSRGVELVVFRSQLGAIDEMESFIEKKGYPYRRVDRDAMRVLDIEGSRAWLASIGIGGEAVGIGSHSGGSLSLVLDEGTAFTGDLAPPDMAGDQDLAAKADWDALRRAGYRRALAAHWRAHDA